MCHKTSNYFYLLFSVVFIISSCDSEEEPYPAFIFLEQATCTSNYTTHGTNSHKLNTAWIFTETYTLGVYDMPHPANIPILEYGEQNIKIRPGFWNSGLSTQPIISPLHTDFDAIVNLNLLETDTIKPVFTYLEDVEMSLNNDFEAFNNFEVKSGSQQVELVNIGAFEGNRSARINLDEQNNTVIYGSQTLYSLDYNDSANYIELDYKNEVPMQVYLRPFYNENERSIVLTLVPQDDWNKVYIDLQDVLIFLASGLAETNIPYEIGFIANLSDSLSTATVALDNIKLLTLPFEG